jgi:hypothetical protein
VQHKDAAVGRKLAREGRASPLGAPLSAPCRSAGPMIAMGGSYGMEAEELN